MAEYHIQKNGKRKRISGTQEHPGGNRPRDADGAPTYRRPGDQQPATNPVKES